MRIKKLVIKKKIYFKDVREYLKEKSNKKDKELNFRELIKDLKKIVKEWRNWYKGE
jgi:hypothetical protein